MDNAQTIPVQQLLELPLFVGILTSIVHHCETAKENVMTIAGWLVHLLLRLNAYYRGIGSPPPPQPFRINIIVGIIMELGLHQNTLI